MRENEKGSIIGQAPEPQPHHIDETFNAAGFISRAAFLIRSDGASGVGLFVGN